MKKIFAIIICLAIFIPSFSFGITQDQYLLLVAKSLFNQVEKLKQEQFYANIFKFMNKPKPQAIQKVIDNEEPTNAQKRNGAFTFDCVKRDIADEIVEKITEKYPDKADSIDTENHKTILWRCEVNVDGEGEYNSLLHCRENCGYIPLHGFDIDQTNNKLISVEMKEQVQEKKQIHKAQIIEEEIVEENEEEIVEEEINNKGNTTRWTIGDDGFCRQADDGEFDNYGSCVKEAKVNPVKKEVPVKVQARRENRVFNWILNALGIQ